MTALHMLQRHDLLPHFRVTDLRGDCVEYASIWQRKRLVLVLLPDFDSPSRHYADRLVEAIRDLTDDTEWILTQDHVEGLPRPGVVVADEWGEIAHSVHATTVQGLPKPDELIDWVRYLQYRCPECEGEAK